MESIMIFQGRFLSFNGEKGRESAHFTRSFLDPIELEFEHTLLEVEIFNRWAFCRVFHIPLTKRNAHW